MGVSVFKGPKCMLSIYIIACTILVSYSHFTWPSVGMGTLLPTGSEEGEVLRVGSIPVAIFPLVKI